MAAPALQENLLSVGQLANDGYDTLFQGSNVFVGKTFQTPKRFAAKGSKTNGAYHLSLTKALPTSNSYALLDTNAFPSSARVATVSIDSAHLALGHLNEKSIRYLAKQGFVPNLTLDMSDQLHPCSGCLEGKARKGTPPSSDSATKKVGDLITLDLTGPIEPVAVCGSRYILTATEVHTHAVHTWPLKTKGAVFETLQSFFNIFEKKYGLIKTIRTDNGGEFTSEQIKTLCDNLGIEHQTTIRYSSHQNGISERANLTILNGIRASLISSGLPWKYWSYALNHITFSRNLSPTITLKDSIPCLALEGKVPDFTYLHPFGAICYAVTQPIDRLAAGSVKLAPRAVKCRFLGYCKDKRGYLLLQDTGKIIESTPHNVTFIPTPSTNQLSPRTSNTVPSTVNDQSIQLLPQPQLHSGSDDNNFSVSIGEADSEPAMDEQESFHSANFELSESESESDLPSHDESLPLEPNFSSNTSNLPSNPVSEPVIFTENTRFGKYRYEPVDTPAKMDVTIPPANAKRRRSPVDYTSAFSTKTSHPCSLCIAGCIAAEDLITPTAAEFMFLASLAWYKESSFVNSSQAQDTSTTFRASAQDPNLPKHHYDIIDRPDAANWIKAEQEEIAQLIAMGTWGKPEPLPPGRQAIKNKWVYRLKTDAHGNVTRYKARLCACGYSQKAGIDYKEVYSPVFRMESSRIFLQIVASRHMQFSQMDVTAAFLNGPLEETIYMQQAPGYEDFNNADYVVLLLRNLYGLKQAPRVWHQTIHPFLVELGFTSLQADPCIYWKGSAKTANLQLISLYVDNLGLAADQDSDLVWLKQQLHSKFVMTDEPDNIFLNLRLTRTETGFELCQESAILDLLTNTNMIDCNPVSIPIDSLNVSSADCPAPNSPEWLEMQSIPYRETIGSLTQICRLTRPDISFAVSVASRYLANPGQSHWKLVKRILRYLKGTSDWVFRIGTSDSFDALLASSLNTTYVNGHSKFFGFADADLAGRKETAQSTSGYGFFMNGSLVSWMSKTQPQVANSSTYAEYIAAYHATTECVWTRNFLAELDLLPSGPTPLLCDNEAAISLAKDHMVNPRSKHFDIKYHYLREQVQKRNLLLVHCPGISNVADIWTKPLPKNRFATLRSLLGVSPVSSHRSTQHVKHVSA